MKIESAILIYLWTINIKITANLNIINKHLKNQLAPIDEKILNSLLSVTKKNDDESLSLEITSEHQSNV